MVPWGLRIGCAAGLAPAWSKSLGEAAAAAGAGDSTLSSEDRVAFREGNGGSHVPEQLISEYPRPASAEKS